MTKTFKKVLAAAAVTAALSVAVSGAAMAEFPEDTINVICHAAAGGGSDAMSREIAQLLQDQQGWTVTVENRTGGSGSVGMQFVMNSKPDGYTIGTAPIELSMVNALGYAEITPDDVTLLGLTMHWPAALYVPGDAPYETLDDFVKYCEENPGVSISNSGIGSIWHLAACTLADKTGIELNYVPYDGASTAISALLQGEVEAAIVGSSEGYTFVESGDVKCLAVFGEESAVLPGVPTAADQGYDIDINCWVGLLAPKDIPDDVKETLVNAIQAAVESDEYIEFAEGRGCDPKFYGPDEFYEMAKADTEYYSQLIEELGIAE